MATILVISGLLLLVSGIVKVRTAARAGLGAPLLELIEIAAGVSLVGMAGLRPPSVEAGLKYVIAAVALILFSSIRMALRLAAGRRKRDESEGGRLVTYVKYLSVEQRTERGPERTAGADAGVTLDPSPPIVG